MKCCDLHTHSVFSDGTWTPRQLVEEAERIGLRAVALTDHNTIAGLPDFLEAAQGREVEAIPGIELSTEYEDRELHIVGLFIMKKHYAAITGLLEDFQRRKDESNVALVERLCKAGFVLDYAAIKATNPNGFINRAHIAAQMLRQGYADSVQDAFQRFLSPKQGFYQPPQRMQALDCIAFLNSIGAVSVLAHPLLSMQLSQADAFLSQAADRGLDAMETHYSTYDETTTQSACALAQRYGLLQSGGSDFHGANKPKIRMGVGEGHLSVPDGFLEQLRKRAVRKG